MPDYRIGFFAQGALPGVELEDSLNAALNEIRADPADLEELLRNGVDEESLRKANFTVTQTAGVGAVAVVVAIGVTVAGRLAADGVKALGQLALRRVRERRGVDGVGRELPPQDDK